MFYRLQNQRKNMELRLASIQENFVKNRTRINRRFVKPHRGFIMYGPPGKEIRLKSEVFFSFIDLF